MRMTFYSICDEISGFRFDFLAVLLLLTNVFFLITVSIYYFSYSFYSFIK